MPRVLFKTREETAAQNAAELKSAQPNEQVTTLEGLLEAARIKLTNLEAESGDVALQSLVANNDAAFRDHEAALEAQRVKVQQIEKGLEAAKRQRTAHEAAEQVKVQERLRERVSGFLDERLEAGREFQDAFDKVMVAYRKMIDTGQKGYVAFPNPLGIDGGGCPQGAALGANELLRLVEIELYRQGGVPPLTVSSYPAFPGGRFASHSAFAGQKEKIPSLVESLTAADKISRDVMAGKRPEPVPVTLQPDRTKPEVATTEDISDVVSVEPEHVRSETIVADTGNPRRIAVKVNGADIDPFTGQPE